MSKFDNLVTTISVAALSGIAVLSFVEGNGVEGLLAVIAAEIVVVGDKLTRIGKPAESKAIRADELVRMVNAASRDGK